MFGILVSITLIKLLSFIEPGCDVSLKAQLHSAYTASVQFHIDHACGEVTEDDLREYGYRPRNENVTLTVIDGSMEGLKITASRAGTPNVYEVDHTGRVSKQ